VPATDGHDVGEANDGDETVFAPVAAHNRKGRGVSTLDVSSTCHAAMDLHRNDGQNNNDCVERNWGRWAIPDDPELEEFVMRLALLSPSDLGSQQHALYDDMRIGIESRFNDFWAINNEGALIGPWNPWLHLPRFGSPLWHLVKALSTSPALPRPVREVATLVTGAHFHSAYELYAHVLVAEARGLPDEKVATIVAGQRPSRAGLSSGSGDLWPEWCCRTDLSGRALLPRRSDPERLRCARAGEQLGKEDPDL
jgi:hypothetical protein